MENLTNIFLQFASLFPQGLKNSFNAFVADSDGAHFQMIGGLIFFGVALALVVYFINKIFERNIHK